MDGPRQHLTALRSRPIVVDRVLAAALALLFAFEVQSSDVEGPRLTLALLGVAVGIALAWRRTAPLTAALVALAALALQGVLVPSGGQEPQTPLIALLLVAYSLAAHAPGRTARIGLAAVAIATLVQELDDAIVLLPLSLGAWSAGRLVRAREHDARRLAGLAAALEQARVEEARLAVADERARIARDLHDVLAHAMTTIVLEAGGERLTLPAGQERTADTLRSIERTGRDALSEMRRVVGALRADGEPASLAPQPGLADVDALVEQVRRTGTPVEVEVRGEAVALAPSLDASAFRIVQEALTNVLRHAGRARARLVLDYGERSLGIEVVDDGRGPQGGPGGHGLTGLRERVALFGGELEATAGATGGFRVRASLPLGDGATMTVRVLIADDQAIVRAGLRRILETDPAIEVVGEATDGVGAVDAAARLRPDVVLMDIRMPRLDGLEATRRVLRAGDPPRVLVLTTFGLDEYVVDALRAGASGFLLKDAPPEDLIAAVLRVASGEAVLDPAVTGAVMARVASAPGPDPKAAARLQELTPREREVLLLIARGRSNAEIAADLVVSEGTVKTHVGRLLMKLHLRDRVQAVVVAYESGLVRAGDTPA